MYKTSNGLALKKPGQLPKSVDYLSSEGEESH